MTLCLQVQLRNERGHRERPKVSNPLKVYYDPEFTNEKTVCFEIIFVKFYSVEGARVRGLDAGQTPQFLTGWLVWREV